MEQNNEINKANTQTPDLQTLDISNIQNDFIYKLVDYYLEEISKEQSDNLVQSITNLVDTLLSYYLLAQKMVLLI